MLPLNFERQFFYIVAFAAVINLVLLFTLIPHLNEIGATVSFLITEIIVTVSMAIFCEKKGFSLFNYGI
jgi:O-antigen/teichoic acid export membrane protein